MQQQQSSGGSDTGLRVALAWAVVLIPLLWGVYNTILNVAKLFS
jgi:hypothetical protein